MTAKQAAEKWGIKQRRVQEMIREGRIEGVQKVGTTQIMPDDTPKPPDLRKQRKNKKLNGNE
jgi:predicted site-specific integrase-resolvase